MWVKKHQSAFVWVLGDFAVSSLEGGFSIPAVLLWNECLLLFCWSCLGYSRDCSAWRRPERDTVLVLQPLLQAQSGKCIQPTFEQANSSTTSGVAMTTLTLRWLLGLRLCFFLSLMQLFPCCLSFCTMWFGLWTVCKLVILNLSWLYLCVLNSLSVLFTAVRILFLDVDRKYLEDFRVETIIVSSTWSVYCSYTQIFDDSDRQSDSHLCCFPQGIYRALKLLTGILTWYIHGMLVFCFVQLPNVSDWQISERPALSKGIS